MKQLTVKQLIIQLKKFPMNKKVFVADNRLSLLKVISVKQISSPQDSINGNAVIYLTNN